MFTVPISGVGTGDRVLEREGEVNDGVPGLSSNAAARCRCLFCSLLSTADNEAAVRSRPSSSAGVLKYVADDGVASTARESSSESSSGEIAQNRP
jgi:hypothetical protein